MNKKYGFGLSAIALSLILGLAACGGGGGGETSKDASLPGFTQFKNVAVHDPSIFRDDDGTYYAFGTHFAVASSKDLKSWSQLASDGQWQFLYGSTSSSWKDILTETVAAVRPDADINSTWAPDVIKIGKKYYMYYSLTKAFGSGTSAIGRVEADSVTGPYKNDVLIVRSAANSSAESNAIDPTVFYDNDGRLWMVYGSAFGGIRLIELNKSGSKVGLPKEEGDKGELLWSGTGNNAEGPYIFYNKTTKYYYLMCSYGDLNNSYNMRVARSKTVNGDYEDITGTVMRQSSTGGNKLAGNYRFAGDTKGYAALGHNSVYVDGNKYLVVHHTRERMGTDGVTPGHHLEVRQMYFTENGWPVLSPNRYARETIGSYDAAKEVPGDYDVVEHLPGITAQFQDSVRYTFTEDGKIAKDGAEVGTWETSGVYYIDITLNGKTYEGVVCPGWIDYLGQSDFSITATSQEGNALWANPAKAA